MQYYKITMLSMFQCPPYEPLNQMTDLNETWYAEYGSGGHLKKVILNLLQPIKWRMHKRVRLKSVPAGLLKLYMATCMFTAAVNLKNVNNNMADAWQVSLGIDLKVIGDGQLKFGPEIHQKLTYQLQMHGILYVSNCKSGKQCEAVRW
jgi:hypothetical protein